MATRNLKITPKALADVQEAMDYYNSRQAALGDRFEGLIAAYFDTIASHPEAGTFYKEQMRYRVIRRFPYLIFYQFNDEAVVILRIFNTQ